MIKRQLQKKQLIINEFFKWLKKSWEHICLVPPTVSKISLLDDGTGNLYQES